jgi:hypothetical protein
MLGSWKLDLHRIKSVQHTFDSPYSVHVLYESCWWPGFHLSMVIKMEDYVHTPNLLFVTYPQS